MEWHAIINKDFWNLVGRMGLFIGSEVKLGELEMTLCPDSPHYRLELRKGDSSLELEPQSGIYYP
jgi:hypothetical protein